MTGAQMPAGSDCVVMLELAKITDREDKQYMTIKRSYNKGDNVSFCGEDAKEGEVLVPKGEAAAGVRREALLRARPRGTVRLRRRRHRVRPASSARTSGSRSPRRRRGPRAREPDRRHQRLAVPHARSRRRASTQVRRARAARRGCRFVYVQSRSAARTSSSSTARRSSSTPTARSSQQAPRVARDGRDRRRRRRRAEARCRGALDARARSASSTQALRAGRARLRRQERLSGRAARPLGRHRFGADAGDRGRRARRRHGARGDDAVAATRADQPRGRARDGAAASACATTRSPIEPMFDAFRDALARRIRGPAAGHDRGEHPGAHPRHAADGAVEQVRLDRAHHRQQVRDGRRLRTLYGDMAGGFAVIKDIAQDAGLPARAD